MTIHIEIVVTFLGALLTLQGWTLIELVNLKTQVAVITQQLNDCQKMNCQQ